MRYKLLFLLFFGFAAQGFAQPWILRQDLPGSNNGRWGALCFSLGGKIYMGGGYIGNLTSIHDFWEYDPVADTWTNKGPMPGSLNRTAGIGFSLNGKGYIGLGSEFYNTLSATFLGDLWEYDPANNSWTQKATFPDSARHHAACFTVNGKAYIVGGNHGYPYKASNQTWEYDPLSDQWTARAPYPAPYIHTAMAFALGNYGYVVGGDTGVASGTDGLSVVSNYRYDPAADTWTKKADYCGYPKEGGVAFVVNNRAYVGTGYTQFDSTSQYDNEFCRYDAASDTWTPYPDLAGQPRSYGIAATVNGKAYVGGGFLYSGAQIYFKDWFQLNDTTLSATNPAGAEPVLIYPNPASDFIYVRPEGNTQVLKLTVFDLQGKKRIEVAGKGAMTVSTTSLLPGLYLVRTEHENTCRYSKLEIRR